MGEMSDPRSRAKEEQALRVFNSVTRGLDNATIQRIRNSATTDYDRGFITVREGMNAWNDVLIVANGVIEGPGDTVHLPQ